MRTGAKAGIGIGATVVVIGGAAAIFGPGLYADWANEGHDWIARWVADPLAGEVAATTVFTDGVSPAESADQLVRLRERLLSELAA
ncbi:hypothetical protein [Promicromonospora sp. NPDC059942]|uniref:hypothetical protein n=1 Tax=Promicromonospora sp. NPDC059942 TaxID=3347009 RepID=UPI003646F1A2